MSLPRVFVAMRPPWRGGRAAEWRTRRPSPGSKPACRPALLLEGVLDVLDGALRLVLGVVDLGLGLIGAALGLEVRVVRGAAGDFLGLALHLVQVAHDCSLAGIPGRSPSRRA